MNAPSPAKRAPLLLPLLACAALACGSGGGDPTAADSGWRVFALRYGESPAFRYSSMVADAPEGARAPLAWTAWLARGHGRVVLIDTGFAGEALASRWKVDGFVPVPEVLGSLGVAPERVTDVVLTHLHWDHAGNVAPYRRARFWVQREELAWARSRVGAARPERSGVRLADLEALDAVAAEGRLELLDGGREILPGIAVHPGGRHTAAIQWLSIRTGRAAGTVVLASDNAYLFENVERRIPIGASDDRERELRTIGRMLETASAPGLVIPGHDPRVFERFPRVAERVVEIGGVPVAGR